MIDEYRTTYLTINKNTADKCLRNRQIQRKCLLCHMSQIHVQYQGKLRTSGRPKVPSSIVVKETLNNTSAFQERTLSLSHSPLIAKA